MATHQELMTQACERWNRHPEWNTADLLDRISYAQRAAWLTGTLNYQVENGGFQQWCGNRYVEHAPALLRVLRAMGQQGFKAAEEVYYLVINAQRDYQASGEYFHGDSLDEKYYEISAQFLEECERFLQQVQAED